MPIRTYSLNFPWLLCVVTAALLTEITSTRAQPIVEWATVAGTSQTDSLNGMALGPAGELYLAGSFGYTDRPNPTEAVLFKYDSSGQQIAVQAWRGELIFDVAVHPEGNYYLTGRVYDPDVLGVGRIHDFYLAKYASDGTLLWERTAGTASPSRSYQADGQPGYKIALDAAGNIYVAGRSTGPAVFNGVAFPATLGGPLLCKFAPDGVLLWAKRAEGK